MNPGSVPNTAASTPNAFFALTSNPESALGMRTGILPRERVVEGGASDGPVAFDDDRQLLGQELLRARLAL